MDIRDLKTWLEEAQMKRLLRKTEAYEASLLPHRKNANQEIERLNWQIYETENAEKLDELDRRAEAKRKKYAEEREKRKQAKKAKGVKHG